MSSTDAPRDAAPGASASPSAAPAAPSPPAPSSDPPTSAATSDPPSEPAAALDPLSAISSMWSGWLSAPAAPADKAPADDPSTAANAPPSAANDLLQGAGKMWNDFGATLKDAAAGTVASVDTSALNQQVDVFRQQSNKLMEDMSKSVQSLNISLPSTTDIDLSRSAEAITSQTKHLIDKATNTLEQSRKEALEIFVDDDDANTNQSNPNPNTTQTDDHSSAANSAQTTQKALAPWDPDALPERERKHADALRREMLKLVVDAIYSKKKRTALFLSDIASKRGFQPFDLTTHSAEAIAALDADTNMRRLRAGLVPGKMKEDTFWTTYFFHVHRIRQTLLANDGVMPEGSGIAEEDDDDDDLFGDGETNSPTLSSAQQPDAPAVKADLVELGASAKASDSTNSGNTVDAAEPAANDSNQAEPAQSEDKATEARDWADELDKAFD